MERSALKKIPRAKIVALHGRHNRAQAKLAVQYATALGRLVKAMRAAVAKTLAPLLRGHVATAKDAAPSDVREALASLKKRAVATFAEQAHGLAAQAVKRAAFVGRGWVDEDARAIVGINMGDQIGESKAMSKRLDQSIQDNVALIKTIPEAYFDRIQDRVREAFEDGELARDIVPDIDEIGAVSERHARFIARDQMAKVTSAANQDRLETLGVEKYVWSTSQDERVRATHAELDGEVFSFDDPPDTSGEGDHNNPGFDFQCFPSAAKLSSHAPVDKLFRHSYRGELTELVTHTGKIVCATSHHPMLTRGAWTAIQAINIGDDIFEASGENAWIAMQNPEHVQPSALDIFRSASLLFDVHRVSQVGVGFHGDASEKEVDVVTIDWNLTLKGDTAGEQEFLEDLFVLADSPGLPAGSFAHLFGRALYTAHSFVRGACKILAFLARGLPHSREHRLRTIAWFHALTAQLGDDGRALHAKAIRKCFDAATSAEGDNHFFARVVFSVARGAVERRKLKTDFFQLHAERFVADSEVARGFRERDAFCQHPLRVVDKRVREFSGAHVYNLQTRVGWYIADGALVRNCRCVAIPYFPELEDDDES